VLRPSDGLPNLHYTPKWKEYQYTKLGGKVTVGFNVDSCAQL